MKKMIAALNAAGIFHVVTAQGIEVMPADLDADGKAQLQKYFGFGPGDFTVPKKLKDPFKFEASKLIQQMAQQSKAKK